MTESSWNLLSIGSRPSKQRPGSIPDLTSQTHLHGINSFWTCMQISLWRQIGNRPMPLTSSVVNQLITNFKLYCCSKKFQMSQKNVQSLLEQLKVCIFAEIVFGVRCTLNSNWSCLLYNKLYCNLLYGWENYFIVIGWEQTN